MIHTGLISKYQGSLGVSRSMRTSSYFNPSSRTTICARWAHGQRWFVYKIILGVSPLVAAILNMSSGRFGGLNVRCFLELE